jgi:hypothetical protein
MKFSHEIVCTSFGIALSVRNLLMMFRDYCIAELGKAEFCREVEEACSKKKAGRPYYWPCSNGTILSSLLDPLVTSKELELFANWLSSCCLLLF